MSATITWALQNLTGLPPYYVLSALELTVACIPSISGLCYGTQKMMFPFHILFSYNAVLHF